MLHALVSAQAEVLRYEYFDGTPPQLAAAKELRWLPVADDRPTPGPGETLTGPVATVSADGVSRIWTVVPSDPPVPHRVTNFQARAALLEAGLFSTVNDALLTLPVDSPERQAWEYANELTRSGTLVNGMAAQLGLTSGQLDALFRRAAQIEA